MINSDAALAYAASGLPIFPVKPRGKVPLIRDWPTEATSDEETIRTWWEKWPLANIGLHVGKAGLAVIDIDPRNGGDASMDSLFSEHGRQWLSSIQVRTGGGGWHFYYALPDRAEVPSSLGRGIDLKRGNGYVLVPPSTHPNGTHYTFDKGGLIDGELDFAPRLPEWCYMPRSVGLIASPLEDWTAGIRTTDPETPENVGRLLNALSYLSANCGRDVWRNLGFAILSTGWECGESIFRDWSMTAPHRFDEDGFQNVVKSAKSDKPNGITLGTLFATASANGWQDPRKAERSIETYGDISNGRRFAERFRGHLLYCHGNGAWYRWDAQRWARC